MRLFPDPSLAIVLSLLALSVGFPSNSDAAQNAPASFGSARIIEDPAQFAHSARAADLNGDGDLDIAYIEGSTSKLRIRINQGNGNFGPSIKISDSEGGQNLALGDIDGDGDADILAGFNFNPRRLVWYQNDGTGGFGAERLVSDQINQMHSILLEDLNGDGRLDFLVSSPARSSVVWYENLGGGNVSAEKLVNARQDGVTGVAVGDLDGDGRTDIVLAGSRADNVVWFRNLGAGAFAPSSVITTEVDTAYNVAVADFDRDGLLDVVSVSMDDDKLAWYRNLGGGTFGGQQVISRAFDQALFVDVADLDGDGDPDVLTGSGDQRGSGKATWFENDGTGSFGNQNILLQGRDANSSIVAADLDSDGDQDVLVSGQWDDFVAWFQNLREPLPFIDTFTADDREVSAGTPVTLSFSVRGADEIRIEPEVGIVDSSTAVVTPQVTTTYTLVATNSAGSISADVTIKVQGPPIISSFRVDPFNILPGGTATLSWEVEDATSIEIDQGIGVVSGTTTQVTPAGGTEPIVDQGAEWRYLDTGVALDGSPWTAADFDDSSWSSGRAKLGYGEDDIETLVDFGPSSSNKFITTYFRKEFELTNVDIITSLSLRLLRDDGAIVYLNGEEIVRSNLPDGPVVWGTLAETAVGGNAEETFLEFLIGKEKLVVGNNVLAVEVHQVNPGSSDLGFDLEFLATSLASESITYTLSATNSFGTSTAQTTLSFREPLFADTPLRLSGGELTNSIKIADVDADGDPDVIAAITDSVLGDGLVWFENIGNLSFSSKRRIASRSQADIVRWAGAADLNGDGRPDAIASSLRGTGKLAWYRNRGDRSFGSKRAITMTGEPLDDQTTVTGDFDGDGDVDIAQAAELPSDEHIIQWYQNNGSGTFSAARRIQGGATDITCLIATDIDGDGFLDLAYTDEDGDKAAWIPNFGDGTFGAERVVTTATDSAQRVAAGDLDGDGDTDLLVHHYLPFAFTKFENLGGGEFGNAETFGQTGQIWTVLISDLDVDGDEDIIYTTWPSDLVQWHENDGSGNFGPRQTAFDSLVGNIRGLAVADVDGDFDPEVLFGSTQASLIDFLINRTNPQPIVRSFTGALDTEQSMAVLSWDVDAAAQISIDGGIGAVSGNRISVPMDATTTFTLTAENDRGSAVAQVTILLDLDSDGLDDAWELLHFGDLSQSGEGDRDSDGLANTDEFDRGTNPTLADTDTDGLTDGDEVVTHLSDPLSPDSDLDGFTDGEEIAAGSNLLDGSEFPPTELLDGLVFYSDLDTEAVDNISLRQGLFEGAGIGFVLAGQVGGALELAAPAVATRKVTFAPVTAPTGEWSVAFWFKAGPSDNPQAIISSDWSGRSFDAQISGGRLLVSAWEAGTGFGLQSMGTIPSDRWTHVTVTMDGGELRAYLNGNQGQFEDADAIPNPQGAPATVPTLTIGGDANGANPLVGCVDDVAVWDRILESSDAFAISTNGGAGNAIARINDRIAAPEITLQPRGGAFASGESTTLSVEFTGTVPIEIQWLRDGTEIPSATADKLVLDSLSVSDSGRYSVVITNGAGDTQSVEVLISVASPNIEQLSEFSLSYSEFGDEEGDDIVIEGDFMFISNQHDRPRGAVHVLRRDAGSPTGWRELQVLRPPFEQGSSPNFGRSIAACGNNLVVGSGKSLVYFYELNAEGEWEGIQIVNMQIGGGSIGFGESVDIDGTRAVIGAYKADDSGNDSGAVFVYEKNEAAGMWEQVARVSTGTEHDGLGGTVAIDGDTIVAVAKDGQSAPQAFQSGTAYIYQRDVVAPGTWSLVTQLQPQGIEMLSNFGDSVDIDGDTVVVGTPEASFGLETAGAVFVFERDAGGVDNWGQTRRVQHSGRRIHDLLGTDVIVRGDRLYASYRTRDPSVTRNGGVVIFDRQPSGSWRQLEELNEIPAVRERRFGITLDLDGGDLAVTSETERGTALSRFYIYKIPPAENQPPTFDSTPVRTAIPNQPYRYAIAASDPDGHTLAIGPGGLPGWLRFQDNGDGTAQISGFPTTAEFGNHRIQLLATDGFIGGTAIQEFTLEVVNTPPIVLGFTPVVADEDSPALTIDLFPGFTDAEYPVEDLVFDIVNKLDGILLDPVEINAEGALVLRFVPDANGDTEIVIRATDPGDLSVTTTIPVTVTPVNDRPVATAGPSIVANGAADRETVDTSNLFSDIDVGDTLEFTIAENSDPSIFASLAIGRETGLLEMAFADYVDGISTITVRAVDSGGLFAETSITVTLPPIAAPQVSLGEEMRLNPQTGLFEHQVTITNGSGRALAAFELRVLNLRGRAIVYNGSGFNLDGSFTVQHHAEVAPGQSVVVTLEYFSDSRRAPEGVAVTAAPLFPVPVRNPGGRLFQIDRVETVPGGLLIEFPSEAGGRYVVQYSHDQITWHTSPMTIRAAGTRVQWIDTGSPKTPQPPGEVDRRHYRIREIPEPDKADRRN